MNHDNATPQRFAAPARLDADLPSEEDQDTTAPAADGDNLHELFEAWSRWSRTRRYFCPPPPAGTILGKLSCKTRPFTSGPPDAECSAQMHALDKAISDQPIEALDTQVFNAYYGERKSYIKRSASEIGISRAHFYRLLKAFCMRVLRASQPIHKSNLDQGEEILRRHAKNNVVK